MRYTLTILEDQLAGLHQAVFSEPGLEGAAYLICGQSQTTSELRFLVREVVPVDGSHYRRRESHRLSIDSASYASVAKRAADAKAAIIFVHSHPDGIPDFSAQDDREEPKLMEFFSSRVPGRAHGSLVVSSESSICGRAWTDNGWVGMERIRIIGQRFRFVDHGQSAAPIPVFFDRQVRAFGPDIQRLLQGLHIGVVGTGGTGSAVAEQLARLGVGNLSLFDGDTFEATNVNRVYGSTVSDVGKNKAEMIAGHIRRIGLPTVVLAYPKHISDEATAKHLRECDIVFGCTDRHTPRGALVRLVIQYFIPVIDIGVLINSQDGLLREIIGRVTTLVPGEACLFCRQRISAKMIWSEGLSDDDRRKLVDENYAPELETEAPAVIPFTTTVASQAISELLHRFTGFKGAERRSSEVLLFLDQGTTGTNRTQPDPSCLCQQTAEWGRGDRRDFLGLTWSN